MQPGLVTNVRFPQGQIFDQKYQEDHAAELAERKEKEKQRKGKYKAVSRSKKQLAVSASLD